MDDKNFRDRIRQKLRGSFGQEAAACGLALDEADPVVPAGDQQGAGVNQANVEKTIKGLLMSLGNVLKTNNKLGTGISIGLKDSDLKKMSTDVASALVKGDANNFKTSLSRGVDTIDKAVLKFAKTQQQQAGAASPNTPNKEGTPGGGVQPLNAAETLGNDVQTLDGSNPATLKTPAAYEAPMRERENPISVSAMQGILKFATPNQIGDAIKALDSDQFAKFVSGLQKDSLDVISSAVNNKGGGTPTPTPNDKAPGAPGAPGSAGSPGHGGGDNNAQGNLKLGDL